MPSKKENSFSIMKTRGVATPEKSFKMDKGIERYARWKATVS